MTEGRGFVPRESGDPYQRRYDWIPVFAGVMEVRGFVIPGPAVKQRDDRGIQKIVL